MTPPSTLPEETPTSSSSTEPTSLENEQTDSSTTLDLSCGAMLARKVTRKENVQVKAIRLLATGRLRVVRVDGNLIVAECRGDSGEVYKLGHEPGAVRPWRCTCPAIGPCSHLHALWGVTAVERQ